MGYVSARCECDVCHKVVDAEGRYTPLGWFTLQMSGPGLRIGGSKLYACTAACALQLLSPAAATLAPVLIMEEE